MKKIPMFKVFIPKTVNKEIIKTLKSGSLSEGPKVKKFQKLISNFIGNKNTVLFNSCTSALTAAYKISGIGLNTEVITTPLTCVAANMPILSLGAKPVWCDVNPKTGMMDVTKIEKLITNKTRAIVVLHKDGIPSEIDKIIKIANKFNIKVIEDAAHIFGGEIKKKKIGNHGDFIAFSFQAVKQINTSDGGALICKNKKDFDEAKKIKWLGIDRDKRKKNKNIWLNDIKTIGTKSNMNDLSATIGIEQMKYVKKILHKYNQNGKYFDKMLNNIGDVELIKKDINNFNTYWVYSFLSKKKTLIEQKLRKSGIDSFQVHPRNDKYSIFKKYRKKLKNLDKFCKKEVNIPCGWWINPKDKLKIVNIIKSVFING
jgi:dTDP-4-amino-4,6-dideoxygalactose transaminase|tara:strand:- start:408 stop:1520 length:1113 start_codon:yes stop_codon:yes gene_type:complete